MSKEIAIEVKNLHKSFRLPTEKSSSIKQVAINLAKGIKGYKEQKVLRGVSFNVKKGDFFGIVGRNGSGKSTLLKLISGIYEPDEGSIRINGSLVSFIELGVGFNSELTGRENIYLNGALMGFSVKEIDAMYDEIVDFAELRDFMNQKLKNYSSGMQVRLAFACAIRAKSDILVLDEVLAVGDEAFQRKCNDYFEKIRNEDGKTVVLVTHSMEAVRKYCNKAILIRDGKEVIGGMPDEVADEYSRENLVAGNIAKNNKQNDAASFISASIIGSPMLTNRDKLQLKIEYRNAEKKPVYAKVVIRYLGVVVMVANGKILYKQKTSDVKTHIIEYELALDNFNFGDYDVVTLLVGYDDDVTIADYGYGGEMMFRIKNLDTDNKIGGAMKNQGKMEFIK